MLVESIVRTTLGLKSHRVVAVEGGPEGLRIELDRIRRRWLPCGICGKRCSMRDRLRRRIWRHVPMWGISVQLVYRPVRVRCSRCGIRVEAIPWARGKSPLSEPLVLVLATWSRLLSWDMVARLFGVSWGTVRAAVRGAVDYGLAHRQDEGVLYIGIDEISRRRGHIYHTQVYDLEGKRLLWSGEGRDAETLERFFAEWGPERTTRIRGICCDMWAPYQEVIEKKVPEAVVVFDKFHLVRHLLQAVDDVRRAEAKELKRQHSELLVGTRYIWLKNPWNLTPNQRQQLGYLERLNLKINRAYLLKEAFHQLWTYNSKTWARKYLKKWFWWATHSRLQPMREFAWKVRRHEEGILAWFDVPLNNGVTEAMNNQAKVVSHRAHGYRTPHTFTLALLHCLGGLPLPQTVHRFL